MRRSLMIVSIFLAANPSFKVNAAGNTRTTTPTKASHSGTPASISPPVTLSPSSLEGLPRLSVRVHPHGSTEEISYEGVALGDVARKFGAAAGEAIRGKNLSVVLVVKAADGYQAVFALPELDAAFSNKVILMADASDGKPLPEEEGPFRLVVPDEKRQARWVRQVVSIELREVK